MPDLSAVVLVIITGIVVTLILAFISDWFVSQQAEHLRTENIALREVAKRTRWLLAQRPYPGRERDEAAILREAEAALAISGEETDVKLRSRH